METFNQSNQHMLAQVLSEQMKRANLNVNLQAMDCQRREVVSRKMVFWKFTPWRARRRPPAPADSAARRVSNRPHFDTIEVKGGGDAVSAARAVIQTGDFDFAWNTQVEDEVLLAGVACHSGWTRSRRGVMRRGDSIRREAFR